MDGIIDNPVTPPESCTRFYDYMGTVETCEQKCDEDAKCDVYTFFSHNHPENIWAGECLYCSKDVVGDNQVPNEYATSGIKESCENPGKLGIYNCFCSL